LPLWLIQRAAPSSPGLLGHASVAELAEPRGRRSQHQGFRRVISTAQEAQRRPRRIEGVRLGEATAWLEEYRQFWERRYSALDELLSQLQAKPAKSKRKRH
jgi:hypothetical protein